MERYFKAFKDVSTLTLFLILNFGLTIVLQVILAARFGAKLEMDAYFTAVAVPIVIVSLLTTTSEVIFVPFFKGMHFDGSRPQLKNIENSIFNILVLGLFALSITGVLFAPKFVKYLAPGFSREGELLVIDLFRILLPSVLFGGLSGFFISIYHSEEKFAWPAFVGIINSMVLIIIFLLFYPRLQIKALALGMLFGYLIQFLFLAPIFFRKRRYVFNIAFSSPQMNKLWKGFLQILIGGFIFGSIIPTERLLASRLPQGSVSYLGYASKIVSLLLFLPSSAIPIVLLPNLSRHFSSQNLEKLRENLSLGIRFVFFIIFPISVLLFVFRTPLIYLFLERGNFDAAATNSVAMALVCYIGVLLGASLSGVTGKGFFAIKKMSIQALIMSCSFFFYLAIAIPLSRYFSFVGLALSLSITLLAGVFIDLFVLRHLLKGIKERSIIVSVSKVIAASIIMGIMAWFLYRTLNLPFGLSEKLHIFIKIMLSASAGLGVFIFFCLLFKSEEFTIIYRTMLARWRHKNNVLGVL